MGGPRGGPPRFWSIESHGGSGTNNAKRSNARGAMNQLPKVHLIDGSSYIYRAFYAIKDLQTSQGFPTNAVYGFSTMLLKVLREMRPEFLAVVMDARGPTFRHLAYEHYKANRPAMPENLRPQIPWIHRIVRAMGIPLLEKEGYEADDLIGSLVERFSAQALEVVIISGDKDLLQLVRPGVVMVDTLHDRLYDSQTVMERYGVEPFRLPDLFGLMGDSSDNIPGVPGIGEKRAREIIRTFGSLEQALASAKEVQPARTREALLGHADQALLSKRLATIDTSVELGVGLENLRCGPPDVEGLREVFKSLEFHRLLQEWTEIQPESQGSCQELSSSQGLAGVMQACQASDRISLWVYGGEGGLPKAQGPKGVALATPGGGLWWLKDLELLEGMRPLVERKWPRKVGHDIKAVSVLLGRRGIRLEGIHGDTMVASYVLNPSRKSHSIEDLAAEFLDRRLALPSQENGAWACQRAAAILDLHEELEHRLTQAGLLELYLGLEMPLVPVLASMERWGIRVDVKLLEGLSREMGSLLDELQGQIHEMAGGPFNINSPQQLSDVLFQRLKLPVLKRTKKGFSTDTEVLESLAQDHPLPAKIIEYRTLTKLKSTYVDALPALVDETTGRVHTSFNQTVTATGRLSSSGPNLQNIPVRTELGQRIRSAFVPEDGWWFLSADYSQVELRILGHLSGDAVLKEAFSKGQDIHARTASEILGVPLEAVTPQMRREAKVINFGIIYGMTSYGLAKELKVEPKVAQAYIDGYFQRYRGVREYLDRVIEEARQKGYVETLLGRRRYLPEISSSNVASRKFAERTAINTPIQGTAADLIKRAMINIHRTMERLGMRSRMLLQVHDELLFEVVDSERAEMEELVRREMEGVQELEVPLKVDMGWGRNWAEAH